MRRFSLFLACVFVLTAVTLFVLHAAPVAATAKAVPGLLVAGSPLLFVLRKPDGSVDNVKLDVEGDNATTEVLQFAERFATDKTAQIQARLTAAEADSTALRTLLVGEIIARRKLAAGEGFDVEGETKWLDGLDVARLSIEWSRTPAPTKPENQVDGGATGKITDEDLNKV